MKYYISHHQHKGKPYRNALSKGGWKRAMEGVDLALFDHLTSPHYSGKFRSVVQDYYNAGAAVVCYPHAATVPWWFDGLMELPLETDCLLVIAEGQKTIAQKYFLHSTRIEVTGFPYCVQKNFVKPNKIEHILFAPIHPAGGKLRIEAVQANNSVYKELKRIQRDHGVEVTVRYVGDMDLQGIKPYPDFNLVEATPDGRTDEIDAADVVIGEGTFLWLAVARGKPTVGMLQHRPIRPNKSDTLWRSNHWELYAGEMAYPINYRIPGDYSREHLWKLLHTAVEEEQTEWRERFIGPSLKSVEFCELMEDVVSNAGR